jgi:hypothetical protein
MADEGGPLAGQATGGPVQLMIIVAREWPDVCRDLTRYFAAHEEVGVLLDRRQGERRQQFKSDAPDRRSPPRPGHDLRSRQYVIIHRKQGRLEG